MIQIDNDKTISDLGVSMYGIYIYFYSTHYAHTKEIYPKSDLRFRQIRY